MFIITFWIIYYIFIIIIIVLKLSVKLIPMALKEPYFKAKSWVIEVTNKLLAWSN